MTSFREDVRGGAGVALATPFFQDLFNIPSGLSAILTSSYPDSWLSRLLTIWSSLHPAFWSSSHPDFWPSVLLAIWSSGQLTIWLSGHLDFWPSFCASDHLTIWSSGLLIIRSFDCPVIWLSGHPNFWPSVLISQKCPDWDIFGLPYCRLHQYQIPNVPQYGIYLVSRKHREIFLTHFC